MAVNLLYVTVPVIIYYPLCFKLGFRKVQILYSIISVLFMGSSVILSMTSITTMSDESGKEVTTFSPLKFSMSVPKCAVMIAVMAVLYVLAFRVSVKEYSKRDE